MTQRNPALELMHNGPSAVISGYAPHANPIVNSILASMSQNVAVFAAANDVSANDVTAPTIRSNLPQVTGGKSL